MPLRCLSRRLSWFPWRAHALQPFPAGCPCPPLEQTPPQTGFTGGGGCDEVAPNSHPASHLSPAVMTEGGRLSAPSTPMGDLSPRAPLLPAGANLSVSYNLSKSPFSYHYVRTGLAPAAVSSADQELRDLGPDPMDNSPKFLTRPSAAPCDLSFPATVSLSYAHLLVTRHQRS